MRVPVPHVPRLTQNLLVQSQDQGNNASSK